MIVNIDITDKSYGHKVLYHDLQLQLRAREKVGLIGRNGTGKTTLFQMLTGADADYAGSIEFQKNLIITSSRQEHHGYEDQPVLVYILTDLPQYARLKHVLDTYPATMGDNMQRLTEYSEALEHFTALGYFDVEDEIRRSLRAYQLSDTQIDGTIGQLSGGQKRFVELVKVQHARADLVLIDEPTNHMDYIAKEVFLEWFKAAREAVLVITHDRDVLRYVDRIVEIRDGRAISFRGNYDDYLRVNATKIVSEVNEYTVVQRRITNLRDDITRFRRLKEKSRDPGTIARFKSLQQRAERELADLEQHDKPSFWIDRESAGNLNQKVSAAYEEHKARNIRVRTRAVASRGSTNLLAVTKLTLSYPGKPLFADLTFELRSGDRLRLHGRNGAGKTTLIQTILATMAGQTPAATVQTGVIEAAKELKVGVYEQEIATAYLPLTLAEAIERALRARDIPVNDQKIRQYLSDYLFDPNTDGQLTMDKLSGGQKARFQLMQMLANDPQLLILDEPTNHLDLPSIEELEDALKAYQGAILYISHDSYFVANLGGATVNVGSV